MQDTLPTLCRVQHKELLGKHQFTAVHLYMVTTLEVQHTVLVTMETLELLVIVLVVRHSIQHTHLLALWGPIKAPLIHQIHQTMVSI